MNDDFNPLKSKLLFTTPKRLNKISAWNEHVPFAMLLIELLRPKKLVELGTHWGISYCAFCQAVVAIGADTLCYAVDTWSGDAHASFYGNEVYDDLKAHHVQYESFSHLLRMTFDEALAQIPDQSVDLLHIDGLHTYEAVKHDYETWRPKMSRRGVILFHDTMVVDRGFGVHQLWDELARQFPNFNFEHGFGLGVLAVGDQQPEPVVQFLQMANAHADSTRKLFSTLGRRLQAEVLLEDSERELSRLHGIEQSRDLRWGRKMIGPLRKIRRLVKK